MAYAAERACQRLRGEGNPEDGGAGQVPQGVPAEVYGGAFAAVAAVPAAGSVYVASTRTDAGCMHFMWPQTYNSCPAELEQLNLEIVVTTDERAAQQEMLQVRRHGRASCRPCVPAPAGVYADMDAGSPRPTRTFAHAWQALAAKRRNKLCCMHADRRCCLGCTLGCTA